MPATADISKSFMQNEKCISVLEVIFSFEQANERKEIKKLQHNAVLKGLKHQTTMIQSAHINLTPLSTGDEKMSGTRLHLCTKWYVLKVFFEPKLE